MSPRAELPFSRGATEAGDPTQVAAAERRGKPPARVWRCGTTNPSLPVAQKWSPTAQRHEKETSGEQIVAFIF